MSDKRKVGNVATMRPAGQKGESSDGGNWDEWYVPASDEKGFSDRLQVKVPPRFIAIAQEITNSPHNPYKSIGFLYRHALVRLFRWLREHPEYGECVGSTVAAMDAMIEIVRDDEYMDNHRAIFDKLEERVKDHRSRGNDSKARQMVLRCWAQINTMTDPFWRKEFEKELRGRFGRFLKE